MVVARACLGCGVLFQPDNANQYYHDRRCQIRNKEKRGAQRRQYPALASAYLNPFLDFILKKKPAGAIGYQLFCYELDCRLPVPGSVRRDGTKPRTDYFTLAPFEVPLLPLATRYQIIWVYSKNVCVSATPPTLVAATWSDDMREKKHLGARLLAYRKQIAQRAIAGAEQGQRMFEENDEAFQPLDESTRQQTGTRKGGAK